MRLRTAPAIWSANMQECVVQPIAQEYQNYMAEKQGLEEAKAAPIEAYLDDIFLSTKTVEDHLILLQITFKQLAKMKLTLSINKCFVGKRKVNLLGVTISGSVIEVQPERLRALKEITPPQNIYHLRGWIGALRYISDHIPDLSLELAKFDALTGKVPATRGRMIPVLWTQELLDDYKEVMRQLDATKVLYHIDPALLLYLETDASKNGFGAVLFQTKEGDEPPFNHVYPIAYYSQKWSTPTARAYDPCTKELKALRESASKWRPILTGMSFTIITDNMGVFGLLKKNE